MTAVDRLSGIHHVTAIAADPRENVAFYTDVLGLRLVKRTVNFDDPSMYHLYYGNEMGDPGTALTFFANGSMRAGQPGTGQATAIGFTVPEGSLPFWEDRLTDYGVDTDDVHERFDERVLPFGDPDGQRLELVTGTTDIEPWGDGPVPAEHAIRGFHGVTLQSADHTATTEVLETLGFEHVGDNDGRRRYRAAGSGAAVLDIRTAPAERGVPGAGTIHHVAVRAEDDESQQAWKERVKDLGLHVTDQKDRRYFRSVYFREPGGILFEIATDGPGFTRDESVDQLGSDLRLPPWLEDRREEIVDRLPSLVPPREAE